MRAREIRKDALPLWLSVDAEGRVWRSVRGTRRRADTAQLTTGYREVWITEWHTVLLAHRVVYAWFNGLTPAGKLVRHLDDNNTNNLPSNLALGSDLDNRADAIRNGRWSEAKRIANLPRGEARSTSVLTEEQVRQIRKGYATGTISTRALGTRFGVSKVTIGNVVARRTWKQVD